MTDDDTRSFDDVQTEVTSHGEVERHSENVEAGCKAPTRVVANEAYDAIYASKGEDVPKRTTGTIDGHSFTLRVDGDAPEALVARIESKLADLKAEVES